VAVDIIDSPVNEYTKITNNCHFIQMNSHSNEFKNMMDNCKFDIIFIDGDHSYDGVKNDYILTQHAGKIYVFHDIVNAVCPGVIQFWNELKNTETKKFDFYEFTEQYDEVIKSTGQHFLGIGVAVSKGAFHS
jgi:hypothetical protein